MKTAKKPTERNRLVVLSVLAAVFSVFFVLLLMSYQIVQGAELNEQTHQMTSSKLPIKAARGDIVDCNGVAFAENKAGFNIVFQYAFLPRSQQNEIGSPASAPAAPAWPGRSRAGRRAPARRGC